MTTSPKTFFWYELMTTDMQVAVAFYTAVVGWRAEAFGQGHHYTVMNAGDDGVGGVMPLPEEARQMGARPAWAGYIRSDDVDAETASLTRAGGTIKRAASDIPDVGRFAVVADPQGAMFMLLKPNGPDKPSVPATTPGHIGWHELYASDWQAAFEFYAGQFGWTKADSMDMGAMGIYQLFAAGGDPIGGMMNKPVAFPAAFWLYYVNVPDIDAAAKRVTDAGGQIMMGPQEVPGGQWIVQCTDPQGAMFALLAPKK
jgi:predicted enzyme related to lactoylglutathione lyase